MPESSGAICFIFLGERVRAQELYAQVNSHLCLTDRQASESPAIGPAVVRESNVTLSSFRLYLSLLATFTLLRWLPPRRWQCLLRTPRISFSSFAPVRS